MELDVNTMMDYEGNCGELPHKHSLKRRWKMDGMHFISKNCPPTPGRIHWQNHRCPQPQSLGKTLLHKDKSIPPAPGPWAQSAGCRARFLGHSPQALRKVRGVLPHLCFTPTDSLKTS